MSYRWVEESLSVGVSQETYAWCEFDEEFDKVAASPYAWAIDIQVC